ncbi:CHAT domain-containing protein [Streptomyces sp. NRRL B-3229]|uniref:CHAT domain-containing protein n=1 Tax=Streptomyces sp. NRRL B-3229 TaxID=1463836 RepID=UPI00131BC739|nr:CHAT domain-containing protein [Streptomyces sp. NRRL B-3229]
MAELMGDGSRVDRLVSLLLTEERGVDPAAAWAGPDPSGGEERGRLDTWLAAAAALTAGEPKRALAVMEGPSPAPHALTRALRAAAHAMDTNWRPGGCLGQLRTEATTTVAGPVADERLRLCAHLAGQCLPVLFAARTTLGQATTGEAALEEAARYGERPEGAEWDFSEGVEEPLRWFDGLYEPIAEAAHEESAACHLLLAADLRVRAGARQAATPLLNAGLRPADRHPALAGLAELLQGDWELGPPGTAEQCVVPPDKPTPSGLAVAAKRYTSAEAAYREAKSLRGQAAALLRLAHVHRLRGETTACRATVAASLTAAVEAGDEACAALLRVHQLLDLIATDSRSPREAEVARAVAAWSTTVGSTSWARGLSQLVQARAESWNAQGYVVRGGRATTLARLLTPDRDAGTANSVTAHSGTAHSGTGHSDAPLPTATYAAARHRLAALVTCDLEQQEHLDHIRHRTGRGEPPDLAHCLGVIREAQVFHHQASALRDPDVMAAARTRIAHALGLGELRVAGLGTLADGPLADVFASLRSDLAACPAQEALFRSRRSRAAGLEEEADRLAGEALAQAGQIPQEPLRGLVRCAALADLGRWETARSEAAALEPRLTALQAATLWVRLGRPERARRHLPLIGDAGPDQEHPWERAALHADLALAEGAHADAADQALRGLAGYEEQRGRLARDTLRASFADDPVPAGLHHAAVLSLLLPGGRDAAAAAFTRAERVRAGFLGAVRALDAAGTDREDRAAVSNWLAAEARWAAEYEDHLGAVRRTAASGAPGGRPEGAGERLSGGALPRAAERRARIAAVDQALAAAETAVRIRVPAALTPVGDDVVPDAAAVAEALPPDTVLLAQHLFDDVLVGWAMTRDRLLVERETAPPGRYRLAHHVVATARRYRDWCAATGDGAPAGADGRRLADWLLRPFAPLLRQCRRVIVVPPPALALLPFHALPWSGDVLGATHEVSYLPAAAQLTRRRAQRPDRPWSRLGALLVGAPASDPRHGLPELPGTAVETAEIARLLPGSRLLTGARATRAAVVEAAPAHDVLHLATHGLIDELAPNRSRLPLAGDDSLGLADLLSMARDPQLLVLSACDTGRGRATAGGDVLGLTRAAQVIGARHTVVSLWPVHDSVGCLVITRMYRHLLVHPAAHVGHALALAQREVRALSAAERGEEFRLLASRAGVDPGPRARARSWSRSWSRGEPPGPSRDSEPVRRPAATERHPYHWAPFIHVGV